MKRLLQTMFLLAFREGLRVYFLVAVVLFVAAVVESVTLYLLG